MLDKKIYQMAGILWLVAVLAVFISLIIALQFDITLNPADIEKALINVHTSTTAHIVELTLDELSFFALIAAAAPLYIIFRRYDTTLALMGTLLLSAGGIVGAAHDMGNFAVTQLADAYATSAGTEAVAIEAATLATVVTAKWGINISALLIALGSIIFNYDNINYIHPVDEYTCGLNLGWLDMNYFSRYQNLDDTVDDFSLFCSIILKNLPSILNPTYFKPVYLVFLIIYLVPSIKMVFFPE